MDTFIEKIDLPAADLPDRWYNVIPDLPRIPDPYLDAATGEPAGLELQERLAPPSITAQEFSLERWIGIPQPVLDAYRLWRPTPLLRARALERELETPAEIWFKYEGASPSARTSSTRRSRRPTSPRTTASSGSSPTPAPASGDRRWRSPVR